MLTSKTAIIAKKVIENGTYESKEAMMDMLDVFLMGGRISTTEYQELVSLLEEKEAEKEQQVSA